MSLPKTEFLSQSAPFQIQVIEDDQKNRGGLFQTGQKGLVPPLVTTSFIAEDQGKSCAQDSCYILNGELSIFEI